MKREDLNQKSPIKNIEMIYNTENKFIKLFDAYSAIASEAIRGERIKLLTPKKYFKNY